MRPSGNGQLGIHITIVADLQLQTEKGIHFYFVVIVAFCGRFPASPVFDCMMRAASYQIIPLLSDGSQFLHPQAPANN